LSGGLQPDDAYFTILETAHDRAGFTCGNESLDRYLKHQARQDIQRKANAVFVLAARAAPAVIIGFYTLCATSCPQGDVPEAARKHIPRYPLVSATLIGRLAIAKPWQGQGLGRVILANALDRAFANASTVGSSMVVVDAIDENAAGFYLAHGFIRLPETSRLIIPMQSLEERR
jgi:GNAT superfamily N-acetyltransferase